MQSGNSLCRNVKLDVGGRYRLTRFRIKHRLPMAIVVAIFAGLFGVLPTFAEWTGYVGSFRMTWDTRT